MNRTATVWLSPAACLVIVGGAVFCLSRAANRAAGGRCEITTNTGDIRIRIENG